MFEVIERINDVNRRVFVLINTESGRELGSYRFSDDAIAHMRRLESARIRRLRDANVKKYGNAK